MKKIILLVLLSVGALLTMSAQNNSNNNLITSGKWYMDFMEIGNKKIKFPDEMKEKNWVIFNSNGLQEILKNGEEITGKWELNTDNNTLSTSVNGKEIIYSIVSISKTNIKLSFTQNENKNLMALKR